MVRSILSENWRLPKRESHDLQTRNYADGLQTSPPPMLCLCGTLKEIALQMGVGA